MVAVGEVFDKQLGEAYCFCRTHNNGGNMELEWSEIVVGTIVTALVIYGMIRDARRCPQCTQWSLVPHSVNTFKSAFGKETFERRRCKGCGFIEHPPGKEHITE